MTPQVYELDIHGTADKYKRGGCRCDLCTAAWMRTVPHGTMSGYSHHGCRCAPCKNGKRKYELARSGRQVTEEPKVYVLGGWNLEEVRSACADFVSQYDRLPRGSETFGLPPGRKWSAARNFASKNGYTLRTLIGGSRVHGTDFTWSVDLIKSAAIAFKREELCWPTVKHGACDAFGGRSWGAAGAWLHKTHGLTLATLKRDVEESTRYEAREWSGTESRVSL